MTEQVTTAKLVAIADAIRDRPLTADDERAIVAALRQMTPLMSVNEAAEHLGVQPQAVRTTLGRYGIREVRGYPEEQVVSLKRKGQGHRSDLERKDAG